MTAAMGISNAVAIAALNTKVDLIDVGGAGNIKIYSGTRPDKVDDAITGTLVTTHTLSATAFGAAADAAPNATATAAAIGDGTAAAGGPHTPTHFRVWSGGGLGIIDGNVGLSSGTFDLEFSSVTWQTNDIISISSYVITELEE